eukprot:12133486-Alexandrium_andersonii.AAC.1
MAERLSARRAPLYTATRGSVPAQVLLRFCPGCSIAHAGCWWWRVDKKANVFGCEARFFVGP